MSKAELSDPRTYAIIGAGIEIHNHLGCGFLEAVYHEALQIEFPNKGIPFEHEVEISISYRGSQLNKTYRADFLCFGEIIVEVKAVKEITSLHEAQLINYLKATGKEAGLILNFGAESLEYRRYNNKNL